MTAIIITELCVTPFLALGTILLKAEIAVIKYQDSQQ
jgi:hypothetical protein